MTDKEIKLASEWCEHFENNVVLKGSGDEKCVQALHMMQIIKEVLKDYNRQKAEIERLKSLSTSNYKVWTVRDKALVLTYTLEDYEEFKRNIESEARKEFAERLRDKAVFLSDYSDICISATLAVRVEDIKKLLKEMTEEKENG